MGLVYDIFEANSALPRKNETKIVKITHSAGTVELAGSHHDPPEDQIDFITPGPSKSIWDGATTWFKSVIPETTLLIEIRSESDSS